MQIDREMMTKVLGYIEKGKQEGAKLMTGGHCVGDKGFYIQPAVFTNVTDDMVIAKEEVKEYNKYVNSFITTLQVLGIMS